MQIRSSALLAALCLLPAAYAESTVQLYGIIDTGIAYSRADGVSRVYQETGFNRPSRFGLKGVEDLGGGNYIRFVLEQGFESNNGAVTSNSKYAWQRESNIAFENRFGRFGMGRIGNFMSGMGSWDPWGPQSGPFATGWGIAASGSTMSDYLRMDNTFAWQSPKMDGWQVMAQYSLDVLGTDEARNSDNTRFLSGGAAYMKGGLNILAFAGRRFNPQIGGAGYKDTDTFGFAANKQFSSFMPFLALQYARNSLSVGKKPLNVFKAVTAKKENTKGITGLAAIGGADIYCFGGTFKAAVQYYKGKNKGLEDHQSLERLIFSAGYEYPLSKRTLVYGGANRGTAQAYPEGKKVRSHVVEVFAGLRHNF